MFQQKNDGSQIYVLVKCTLISLTSPCTEPMTMEGYRPWAQMIYVGPAPLSADTPTPQSAAFCGAGNNCWDGGGDEKWADIN